MPPLTRPNRPTVCAAGWLNNLGLRFWHLAEVRDIPRPKADVMESLLRAVYVAGYTDEISTILSLAGYIFILTNVAEPEMIQPVGFVSVFGGKADAP
jgi:hypothetical protein